MQSSAALADKGRFEEFKYSLWTLDGMERNTREKQKTFIFLAA